MAKKSKRVTAEYIAGKCSELADQNGSHLGSYLLKMACLEFTKQQDQLDRRATGGRST